MKLRFRMTQTGKPFGQTVRHRASDRRSNDDWKWDQATAAALGGPGRTRRERRECPLDRHPHPYSVPSSAGPSGLKSNAVGLSAKVR